MYNQLVISSSRENYTKKEITNRKWFKYNTDKFCKRRRTKNNQIPFHKEDRNHTPNAVEIGVKKCNSKIKEMPNQSESILLQIFV